MIGRLMKFSPRMQHWNPYYVGDYIIVLEETDEIIKYRWLSKGSDIQDNCYLRTEHKIDSDPIKWFDEV